MNNEKFIIDILLEKSMQIEDLKSFGISESIIEKLKSLGFVSLTPVQEEAIKKGLFEGKSLVVSAPTNTGKTFIAELAMLVASKKRKRTFYLVPLKAIAEEKFDELQEKYFDWGLRIAVSTSERTEYDLNLSEYDLVIATYEKLNALLVRNPNLIKEIGLRARK
jgi:helicase